MGGTQSRAEGIVEELRDVTAALTSAAQLRRPSATAAAASPTNALCGFTSQTDYFDHSLGKTVTCLTCSNPAAAKRVERGNHLVRMTQHPNVPHYVADAKWNGRLASLTVLPPVHALVAGGAPAQQSFALLQMHLSEILFGFAGVLDAVIALSARVQFEALHPSQLFVVPVPPPAKATAAAVLAGRWLIADLSTTAECTGLPESDSSAVTNRAVAVCLVQLILGLASQESQRRQLARLCPHVPLVALVAAVHDAANALRETSSEQQPANDSVVVPQEDFAATPPPTEGETPSVAPAEPAASEAMRSRFIRFMTFHNPAKLEKPGFLEQVLKQYAAQEDALFAALVAKYGPEPPAALEEDLPEQADMTVNGETAAAAAAAVEDATTSGEPEVHTVEAAEAAADDGEAQSPSPPAAPLDEATPPPNASPPVSDARDEFAEADTRVMRWIVDALAGRPCSVVELRDVLLNGFGDPLCRALRVGAKLHTYSEGSPGDAGFTSPKGPASEPLDSDGGCGRGHAAPEPRTVYDAYEAIAACVVELLEDSAAYAGLAERRVLPWILQPMHIAQSGAATLFSTLLDPNGPLLKRAASGDVAIVDLLHLFVQRCFESPDMVVRAGFLRFLPTLLPRQLVSTPLLAGNVLHAFSFALFQFRVALHAKGTGPLPPVDKNWCNGMRWHLRTVPALCVETLQRSATGAFDEECASRFVNTVVVGEVLAVVHALIAQYPLYSPHTADPRPELFAAQPLMLKVLSAAVTAVAALWGAHPQLQRAPLLETLAHCLYYGAVETRELSIGLLLGLLGTGAPALTSRDVRLWWLPLFSPLCADREKRIRHGACDVVLKLLSFLHQENGSSSSAAPAPTDDEAELGASKLVTLIQPLEDAAAAALSRAADLLASAGSSSRRPDVDAFVAFHRTTYAQLWERQEHVAESRKAATTTTTAAGGGNTPSAAFTGLVPCKDFLAQQAKAAVAAGGGGGGGVVLCGYSPFPRGSFEGLLLPQALH